MSNVVPIDQHVALLANLSETKGSAYEAFLLEEGLALLAHYRSIESRDVRLAMTALLDAVAASGRHAVPVSGVD
jgi:hypothetical protein